MSDVRKELAELFSVDESALTDTAGPDAIEGWDSLTQIILISSLEEKYKISFTEEEVLSMDCVKAVCDLVNDKMGSN